LFDRVNGVSTIPDERRGLAAVDATTARLLLWNPAPYRDSRLPPTIDALAVHGSNVYVGGFFSELGGAPRSLLGAVDAVTGNSTNWAPAPGNWGKALVVTDDRVFVGMPRKVAALDASTGAELWANNAVGSVDALVMSNGLLIAAGSFVAINGENRRGLAALDPATGTVTPWNPDLNRPTNALAVVGDKLFGVSGRGVYSLPLPVKTTARSLAVRPAPARPTSVTRLSEIQSGGAQLSLSVPESGPVSVGVFDLQGRRVATVLDHTWLEAGAHEQAIRTADWPRGLYFVRVDLAGRTETHRIAVIR
jgi:hypothetical protein